MACKFTFPGNRRKWGFQGIVDALRTKTTAIISKYCFFLSCLSPREENIAEQALVKKHNSAVTLLGRKAAACFLCSKAAS